ncbi:MAG: hypothetical protein U1F77_16135 [Kiritimatiellia bacterium]
MKTRINPSLGVPGWIMPVIMGSATAHWVVGYPKLTSGATITIVLSIVFAVVYKELLDLVIGLARRGKVDHGGPDKPGGA